MSRPLTLCAVTAPVIPTFGFIKIAADNVVGYAGAFGYCQTAPSRSCTAKSVGYAISGMVNRMGSGINVSSSANYLTKAFILHPFGAVLCFLAVLVSIFSNKFGFIVVNIASGIAALTVCAVFAIDCLVFRYIVVEVESDKTNHGSASYGVAFILVLISFILILVGMVMSFFQCCCGRTKRERKFQKDVKDLEQMGFLSNHHNKHTGHDSYHNPYQHIDANTHH